MPSAAGAGRVRIDKWLWAARFFKTRSLAAEAVEGGKAQWQGNRVKPAHAVKVGDRLQVRIGAMHWEIDVLALSERRGSASIAQTLYRETPESLAEPRRPGWRRRRQAAGAGRRGRARSRQHRDRGSRRGLAR
ncbi:MAG: RNA-binding S4 domain-containing protein, partial [Betaproteobacteria bacterium]|nr:RNA-binding S4 domain-containing protein [Betaproteobacteria bacterium]